MAITCTFEKYYSPVLNREVFTNEKISDLIDINADDYLKATWHSIHCITIQDFIDYICFKSAYKINHCVSLSACITFECGYAVRTIIKLLGLTDVINNPEKYFNNQEKLEDFQYLSDAVGSWDEFSRIHIKNIQTKISIPSSLTKSEKDILGYYNGSSGSGSISHIVVRNYPSKNLTEPGPLYNICEMINFDGSNLQKSLKSKESKLIFSDVDIKTTSYPSNIIFEWMKMLDMNVTYEEVETMINDSSCNEIRFENVQFRKNPRKRTYCFKKKIFLKTMNYVMLPYADEEYLEMYKELVSLKYIAQRVNKSMLAVRDYMEDMLPIALSNYFYEAYLNGGSIE